MLTGVKGSPPQQSGLSSSIDPDICLDADKLPKKHRTALSKDGREYSW